MIYRVVRLHFRPEATATFEAFFREKKALIEAQDGCRTVQLLRDTKEPEVYYTLSEWDSEEDLDRYRSSAFFGETWRFMKTLFAAPAEAFSGLPVA